MFFRFGRHNKQAALEQKQQGDAALQAGDAETAERRYRAALELDPRQAAVLCNLGYALHGQGKDAEAGLRLAGALEIDASLPDAHFLAGRLDHGARKMDAAEAHFHATLALAPDHELCYFEYCHLLVEQDRAEAALQLILRALERFPANPDFQAYLGNLHYQSGDIAAAVTAFERALSLRSDDVVAMANLSKALMARGCHERAADVANAALEYAPHLYDVRLTLAMALDCMGQDARAEPHYRACLQDAGQEGASRAALARLLLRMGRVAEAQEVGADADLHFLAAHALHEAGDTEGAMTAYRRALALREDHVEARINLALLHLAHSERDEALRLLSAAERTAPGNVVVHTNLGSILLAAGRHEEAIVAYGKAVACDAGRFEAHFGLGKALFYAGKHEDACDSASRAVEIDPRHAEAQLDLALALQAARRHDAALVAFRRAHAMMPDDARLPLLLASALIQTDAGGEAIVLLQALCASDPGNVDAHMLLGSALAEAARFDEARASYERALALKPDHIDAKASHGLLCLLMGDFENGWEGYCRLPQVFGMVPLPDFGSPLWNNEADLAGKSLLLYAEQGMGDAMQFVRYIERIATMGGTIHLAVQPALLGVMQSLPWPIEVHSKAAPLPATDFHCPLGQLPHAFATRLDTIPAPVPYLHPNVARAAIWQARLAHTGLHTGKQVGLVWSGNPVFSGDRDRSLSFELVERLLALPDYCFHSLQKDVRKTDVAPLAAAQNIADLGPSLIDFAETAAVIANLDLVITVDTSVAHLAGAMGKPVWVLLPFSPDFRWLLERNDSPWYPSARLFRQRVPGDWGSVVDEVFAALEVARLGAEFTFP